jgi:hypothetical protein
MSHSKLDHLYIVRMAEIRLHRLDGMLAKNQVTDPPLECRDLQMKSLPNVFVLVVPGIAQSIYGLAVG